jgi:hypothetical protein
MLIGNSQVGVITSKSIGGVSASYGIPQKILENPLYSYLATTPYGLKYLACISGRLKGNIIIVQGGTNAF